MSQLVSLMKRAHAIEIGAFEAYEGHARAEFKKRPGVSVRIKSIQIDELDHRENLYHMLRDLGARPNPLLDALLFVIGRSISVACLVMGSRLAAFGAKILEILGARIYHRLAQLARDEGEPALAVEFDYMARAEESHEEFFRQLK